MGDSIQGILDDMRKTTSSSGEYIICSYFGREKEGCSGCPADESNSCGESCIEDVVRRIESVMPRDHAGVLISPGDVIRPFGGDQSVKVSDISIVVHGEDIYDFGSDVYVTDSSSWEICGGKNIDSLDAIIGDYESGNPCAYFHMSNVGDCSGCPADVPGKSCFAQMTEDVIRRIRGVLERVGNGSGAGSGNAGRDVWPTYDDGSKVSIGDDVFFGGASFTVHGIMVFDDHACLLDSMERVFAVVKSGEHVSRCR